MYQNSWPTILPLEIVNWASPTHTYFEPAPQFLKRGQPKIQHSLIKESLGLSTGYFFHGFRGYQGLASWHHSGHTTTILPFCTWVATALRFTLTPL